MHHVLLEKGFNVRVACDSLDEAVKGFGKNGFNVDIVPLTINSSEKEFARAIQGIQAIIFTSNFIVPDISPLKMSNNNKVESNFEIAKKIVDISTKAKVAKVQDIAKIVFVSRFIDKNSVYSTTAEKKKSSFTTFLDDFINALVDPVEINVGGEMFKDFRDRHAEFEQVVKKSGFDYVIVRAPPIVMRYSTSSDLFEFLRFLIFGSFI